jgi:peptidoglycan/LPS O-acetylase OafA/YrhL
MRTEMAPPSEIALKGAAAVGLVQSWSLTTALEWNAPGWTLACEAFFYLLFPLLAPWFSKLSGRQALGAIGALWALALVRFLPLGRDPWWLTISPIARLPEFLMGMCASVLLVSMLPETRRRIRLPIAIGALVIIALAFALHDRIGRAVLDCGTLGPVFAALIVALAFYGDMPVPKIATKLGESSYDLYVIQIGVMAIAGKCLSVVHVPAYSPLRFIVLVLAVIIASRFVHRWISRPSRQRLLRLSKRSSTPSTEPARPLP